MNRYYVWVSLSFMGIMLCFFVYLAVHSYQNHHDKNNQIQQAKAFFGNTSTSDKTISAQDFFNPPTKNKSR